jgi:nucleotide-binding universal stress UspA family protein
MYDSILVPTDGSQHAQRAAEHARLFAKRFGTAIHVLAVIDTDAAAGPFSAGGLSEDQKRQLEADAADTIADIEALLEEGITVRTTSVFGRPTEAIPEYVADNGIDAVAMGTHGRTGVHRFVAGSVTEAVLREVTVPVLTVRAVEQAEADGYDEIVIPTDGSEPVEVAVDHAIEIARGFDARVHALNIVDMSAVSRLGVQSASDSILGSLREAGESATDEIVERARSAGLEAESEVRRGYPTRGILDYIEDVSADLTVMGTAGQTGLSRFLLGSTTEQVIRHAETPVLAVTARSSE